MTQRIYDSAYCGLEAMLERIMSQRSEGNEQAAFRPVRVRGVVPRANCAYQQNH